ncbi:hypothetical protein RvY_16173 [Ramazzottius varieornatus]|uniref:Uncharacterized protein n=1 Tax=Ramazzottius varieornatus TaxID=947166 RepID=A0A1D1VXI8_RAMVA|nr:hypothetical protein RvY_16173 [Ramazzottius varieornatus]
MGFPHSTAYLTVTANVHRVDFGPDQPYEGANGSRGNCCGGMHCQKNDPSWAQGRCYYNPGRK